MSKLVCKYSKGWYGIKRAVPKDHDSQNNIKGFSRSNISSRIPRYMCVDDYGAGGDVDGVSTVKWKEKLTSSEKTAIIAAAVACALLAGAGAIAAASALSFGIGGIAVAAVITAGATAAAIAGFLYRERSYEGEFNSTTGKLLDKNEAEKIKKLNRGKIKQDLEEIDKLLENEEETDEAKEKLAKLFEEHKDYLSKTNKNQYDNLVKKQKVKEDHLEKRLENTNKAFNEGKKKADEKLARADEDRKKIAEKEKTELLKVREEVKKSQKEAKEKFILANKERDKLQKEIDKELKEQSDKKTHLIDRQIAESEKQRIEIHKANAEKLDTIQINLEIC